MLSKTCQHGIKAMICITQNAKESKRVSIADISSKINVPEAFTSKIMQRLVKSGMVKSKKGAHGGFYVEERLIHKITVWDVVSELDGGELKYGCILGLTTCSSRNPCPAHDQYKPVRNNLINFMESTYLADLADKLKAGNGNIVLQLLSI